MFLAVWLKVLSNKRLGKYLIPGGSMKQLEKLNNTNLGILAYLHLGRHVSI
jgi:hypothetical protein